MLTKAEIERQEKIAANRLLLESFGLEGGGDAVLLAKPKPKPAAKPKGTKAPRKRRNTDSDSDEDQKNSSRKAARTDAEPNGDSEPGSVRRSGRLAGKKIDYANVERDPSVRTLKSQGAIGGAMDRAPRSLEKRTNSPYVAIYIIHMQWI